VAILKSRSLRLYLMRIRYKNINRTVLESIVLKIKSGDWFLLYLLGDVDPDVFQQMMHEFSNRLSSNEGGSIEFNELP
ncbi:hypothetical protein L9F63_005904, partial [Diploptera punctata]